MDRGAWQATVHGVARVGHDWAMKHKHPHPHGPEDCKESDTTEATYQAVTHLARSTDFAVP